MDLLVRYFWPIVNIILSVVCGSFWVYTAFTSDSSLNVYLGISWGLLSLWVLCLNIKQLLSL